MCSPPRRLSATGTVLWTGHYGTPAAGDDGFALAYNPVRNTYAFVGRANPNTNPNPENVRRALMPMNLTSIGSEADMFLIFSFF